MLALGQGPLAYHIEESGIRRAIRAEVNRVDLARRQVPSGPICRAEPHPVPGLEPLSHLPLPIFGTVIPSPAWASWVCHYAACATRITRRGSLGSSGIRRAIVHSGGLIDIGTLGINSVRVHLRRAVCGGWRGSALALRQGPARVCLKKSGVLLSIRADIYGGNQVRVSVLLAAIHRQQIAPVGGLESLALFPLPLFAPLIRHTGTVRAPWLRPYATRRGRSGGGRGGLSLDFAVAGLTEIPLTTVELGGLCTKSIP